MIRNRLAQYHEKTAPLISYYDERGLLETVNGSRAPDEVAEKIRGVLATLRMEEEALMYRGGIILKTPEQIEQMAAAGAIQARCLQMLRSKCRPGVTTAELDLAAERFIASQDAEPSFLGYRGFPGSICASPNSMVVHGIPGPYELERGDILSIDVGVTKDGWVADAAITVPVGEVSPPTRQLLDDDRGSASRRRRAGAPGQPPRRRLARDPAAGRGRRPLDHPLPRRPRRRPRHARGPAGPQLRRARPRPRARARHGARDRADGQRRRPDVRLGDDNWAVYSADGSLAAHFEFTVASPRTAPASSPPGTRSL